MTPDTQAKVSSFISQVEPQATRAAVQLGVPVDAVIGQWGLETGWGQSVIPGTNNYGNIKSFNGSGVTATDNQNGSVDKYRAYENADHFTDDFLNVVSNPRYAGLAGAKDPASYFTALKRGGYAEDPNYVSKGISAANMVAMARNR